MGVFTWTRCPRCQKDWALRITAMADTQRSDRSSGFRSLLVPTPALALDETSWKCDCGALLRLRRRRFSIADFILIVVIAAAWVSIALLTGLAATYPRLCWFLGVLLVVIGLSLRGVGKHEVQVAGQ